MNVIDYLEHDHKTVLDLLQQLEETSHHAVKTREFLFQKIRTELALHEIVEEKILYPQLKAEDEKLILEACEEHRVIDRIINELTKTSVADETWIAKVTVIRENLEHHVGEERTKLFKLAKKLFDETALKKMADDMRAMKTKLSEPEHTVAA